MRFSCQVNDLLEGLSVASRALSARTTQPILEGVFIKTGEDMLKLTCSDGSISIVTQVSASIEEDGDLVLPGLVDSHVHLTSNPDRQWWQSAVVPVEASTINGVVNAAKTVRASSMKRSISRVCVSGFQFTRNPGSAAAAGGMARLDSQPRTAIASTATATRAGPSAPITNRPPTMVPARIATKPQVAR